ncbi:calpain-9-like isoform X2 [Octopus vulgaris]|uniref:Calpain-9-like isoform X2 n=1 Tax=Octopus vulgaris TaxID=6645 RepID=A0AA36BAP8_OCTVU|nr:calpain-9-like isoform X2 [Octopus vulgaris]
MNSGNQFLRREAVFTPQPYRSQQNNEFPAKQRNSISSQQLDSGISSPLPTKLKARNFASNIAFTSKTTVTNGTSHEETISYTNNNLNMSKEDTYMSGKSNKQISRLYDIVRRNCKQQAELFEDKDFPANDASIYFSRHPPYQFEWRRCSALSKLTGIQPKFFVDGIGGFDVQQGQLGDSWLLAAIACLATPGCSTLFHRVIPLNQSFHVNDYCGAFYFNFWHSGNWVEIVVDDYLPTYEGQYCFLHSSKSNEFWPALLEKAYAKMYGSYEALKVNVFEDVLADLTGGLIESYKLHGANANVPENIINILFKALDRYSIVACGINSLSLDEKQCELPNGLLSGHIYNITDLRQLLLPSDQGNRSVTLIRIRNPWGEHIAWNGPWNERSVEWNSIPSDEREKLGLVFNDDGEFWMDFNDFKAHFDTLNICNLSPDAPLNMPRTWFAVEFHNRWYKGFSAGGRPSCSTTHWSNPQYRMILGDSDEDDDTHCSVILQLAQKDCRRIKLKNPCLQYIGFVIYKNDLHHALPLQYEFFKKYSSVTSVDAFMNGRQVVKRFALKPGEYIVLPCTYEANLEASFLIRFFMEKPNIVEPADNIPSLVSQPPKDFIDEKDTECFKEHFYRISGEDMEIDSFELHNILDEEFKHDIPYHYTGLDTCKNFVFLMDTNNSGKIGFSEFLVLWSYILAWRRIFQTFDANKTGSLNSFELQRAITATGYKMSSSIHRILCFHYVDKDWTVNMNSFLLCVTNLMKHFNTFKASQQKGQIILTIEKWLEKVLL